MKAKEYMQQLERIKVKIENYKDRLATLKEIAISISVPYGSERVQTSRNGSKIENSVSEYIDMEKKLQDDIVKLLKTRVEILNTIEELPANEYDFLYKRYFKEMSYNDIADFNERNYGWAMWMQKKALDHLQEILDNRESVER